MYYYYYFFFFLTAHFAGKWGPFPPPFFFFWGGGGGSAQNDGAPPPPPPSLMVLDPPLWLTPCLGSLIWRGLLVVAGPVVTSACLHSSCLGTQHPAEMEQGEDIIQMRTPKYLFPRGNKPLFHLQIGNTNFFIFITNQSTLMFCVDKIKYGHLAILSNLKSCQFAPKIVIFNLCICCQFEDSHIILPRIIPVSHHNILN